MPRYRHGILWPRRVGRAALASDNAEEREAALSEGQPILDKGCLGHNFYWFHRDAMATYLQAQDWDAVERHAGALANFMVEDPLPYAAFYIERARAMAALGSNRNDAAARAGQVSGDLPYATSLTCVLACLRARIFQPWRNFKPLRASSGIWKSLVVTKTRLLRVIHASYSIPE